MNPIHTIPNYLSKIHFNNILPPMSSNAINNKIYSCVKGSILWQDA
jgi:hypothetical protein